MNCLYDLFALIERPGVTLDEILQGSALLIPSAWQYPDIACARIVFGGRTFVSRRFRRTKRRQVHRITVRGEQVGHVEVCDREERTGAGDEVLLEGRSTLLEAIAQRLGHVAERLQAEEELARLAATDSLTGSFNRRHFLNLAAHELTRSQRYGHPVSCIMLDIDSFKQINDTHGHLFGDWVLRAVVTRCCKSLRDVDLFARFGGDEFVILLPETGVQEAERVARRLRASFTRRSVEIESQTVVVTVSVGVASIDDAETATVDALVRHADQALYASKRRGRNRVSVWRAKRREPSGPRCNLGLVERCDEAAEKA